MESQQECLPQWDQAQLEAQWSDWLRQPQAVIDASRQLCEASFFDFILQAWPIIEPNPYQHNWHVELMADALQAVHEGAVLKLLMNVPPGCTKSLITSVFWPAWRWARKPWLRFVFACYDHGLSIRDAVRTRNLIESPWYQERWGDKVEFASDQNQKVYYETTAGGFRLSTIPNGRGTGEHPDCFCFDDPHNVKRAESPTERQSVLDWWDLTVTLRGASKRSERVGVMQRLNEEDLSGHVLKKPDWVHVCVPMRYEPDRMKVMPFRRGSTGEFWSDLRAPGGEFAGRELLWPSVFGEDKVREFEYSLGSYGAAGQLQQRPAPREGGMFKREWFNNKIIKPERLPRPSEFDALCRYWDKAGTQDAGDDTAGVLIGRKGDDFFALDVVVGQWSAGKRDDNIDLTAVMDETEYGLTVMTRFEQEPGSGGKQSAEISVDRLRGLRVGVEKPITAKPIRAEPLAIECERGHFYMVEAHWNKALIDELCVFPHGAKDNRVDAAAGAYRYLARPRKKLLVAGATDPPAQDGGYGHICKTAGCQRLIEPGTEYCCAQCRETGNTDAAPHSPACCVRWNDHYVKLQS